MVLSDLVLVLESPTVFFPGMAFPFKNVCLLFLIYLSYFVNPIQKQESFAAYQFSSFCHDKLTISHCLLTFLNVVQN
jgi:hypothetical protein